MKVEEQQNEGYREIPGLPEPDRGGKKGKKKNNANSKKNLNLPNFSDPTKGSSGMNNAVQQPPMMEERPPRPQLSDKEAACLESCHSYIFDYLKMSGPMNAFDTRLQTEINQFPPEAKSVITKVGGLKSFILLCEDLLVVDKIVGAKIHANKIKELALRDVCNSLPGGAQQPSINSGAAGGGQQPSGGGSLMMPGQEKQIWNSAAALANTMAANNNSNSPNKIVGKMGHNTQAGLENTIQYHSTTANSTVGNVGPQPTTAQQHQFQQQQHFGSIGDRSISQTQLGAPGDHRMNPPKQNQIPGLENLDHLQKEVFRLTSANKELISKLAEKDKQIHELRQYEGRMTQLELETDQARIQINKYRDQIERLKTELAEAKSAQADHNSKHKAFSDNDRDLILSLQKQLDAEKLKTLNLSSQQVDSQLANLALGTSTGQGVNSVVGDHINKQNVFAPLNNSLHRQNSFVNLVGGGVSGAPPSGGGANVAPTVVPPSSTPSLSLDDQFGLRNMSFGGGLELKSTPNLFGAIGSDLGKRTASNSTSVLPMVGLQQAPGSSVSSNSSSSNLINSAGAGARTAGLTASLGGVGTSVSAASHGSRGPSPNFSGFSSALGGGGGGVLPSFPGFSSAPGAPQSILPGGGNQSLLNSVSSSTSHQSSLVPGPFSSAGNDSLMSMLAGGGGLHPSSHQHHNHNIQQPQHIPSPSGDTPPPSQTQQTNSSTSSVLSNFLSQHHHLQGNNSFTSNTSNSTAFGTSFGPTAAGTTSDFGGGGSSFGLGHLGSAAVNSAVNSSSAAVQQQVVVGGDSSHHNPQQQLQDSTAVGAPTQPGQGGKSNSAIRQEQLVKKLVNQIPGSDEESIKHYIQVLRERHGKLSGWSTNKITQEIILLINQK
eukprot:TRINITY_DN13610_c0_g1_i2.p1 TRINITY_DN13610_c0_g1~~TRINITY_DN13610_c0_g1_i2.p1  ORF type:complete len:884 (+),score=242.62 TRINITY_DN13610_c0_g1_i2:38-2689(+)